MRVLHVSSGNLYGGIEAYLTTLARLRALTPAMEPEFALCFEGRQREELEGQGVPVHMLGAVRVSRPWTVLRARAAMRRLLAARAFDVVVCHASWTMAIFGPVVRAARVPLAMMQHGGIDGTHPLERLARRTRPDLLIANSEFTRGELARWMPDVPVRVVYLPVEPPPAPDSSVRAAVRAMHDTADASVVIVQASRFERGKGHGALLQALASMSDAPDWTCWVIGGAQDRVEAAYVTELRARAEALGIAGRLRWLGERRDVPRLLAAADVLCQPNLRPEGFGLSFVEAMHAGLPVVTTAIGSAPEIVTPEVGTLVARDDVDALAAALREWVTSPARRAAAADHARARARALTDTGTTLASLHAALAGATRGEPVLRDAERGHGRALPEARA